MWNRCKSDHMFAGKWQTFTPTHEPGHIFKLGNIPLSGLVSRNWCPATTLGIPFWVWCDLWWLQHGNSFIVLQFIGSDNALYNKLVHSQNPFQSALSPFCFGQNPSFGGGNWKSIPKSVLKIEFPLKIYRQIWKLVVWNQYLKCV